MLISFLERGNDLKSLSKPQMLEVEAAFLLYLTKAISFREAFTQCEMVLDDDQEHLRVAIKSKLSRMIEDADCNIRFKPAILRLAAGDDTGFRKLNAPVNRTSSIIQKHKRLLKGRLSKLAFPIEQIGPKHLASLEMQHLESVEPHARRYVNRHARFLTMGDSGTTVDDLTRDLIVLALRAMRWYYPFLSGLHMSNTMRRTITNRGRGLVTYSVSGSRQRLVMDESGRMLNRESSLEFDSASNWQGWSENPSGERDLQFDIRQLAKTSAVHELMAKFLLDGKVQEAFCHWLEGIIPSCAGCADVSAAVKKSGHEYAVLLSRFLSVPKDSIEQALTDFRSLAA